jgi:pimeloyl-ACP methyl ester carboxylesterase
MRAHVWVVCLGGAMLPLGCDAADRSQVSPCEALERAPVVFVHGSGLKDTLWNDMRAAMVDGGYRREWLEAVQLVPDDGANVRAAERILRPAVDAVLERAESLAKEQGCRTPRRVDLVAHSMGAVSARWYAARIAPEKVRTLVGIAPSNHGTNALCGLSGAGNAEMCPAFARGGVQLDLNGSASSPRDETPFGTGADSRTAVRVAPEPLRTIDYFTLRLEPDEWIKPESSAVLDGAGGRTWPTLPRDARETTPGNVLWGSPAGHDSFPGDPELIATVVALLTEGPAP